MRRVSRQWNTLASQLDLAANGIAGEPAWPASAPTQAEVQAAGEAIREIRLEVSSLERKLRGKRSELAKAMAEGTRLMRLVDHTVQGIYEQGDPSQVAFGIRPIDRTRNSPGPTPQVEQLQLADGLAPGSIELRWKTIPRATFEIQWFADEALQTLLGAMASTKRKASIAGLTPGTQVWVRVRALRGGRYGDWSETRTRIANV